MDKSVLKYLTSALFMDRLGDINKLVIKYFTMENHSVVLFSLSTFKGNIDKDHYCHMEV